MRPVTCEVQGHTVFNQPASPELKFASGVLDVCISLVVSASFLSLLKIAPLPNIQVGLIFLISSTLYWVPQKILFGVTLGERIWKLRAHQKSWYNLKEPIFQSKHLSGLSLVGSGIASAFTLMSTLIILKIITAAHPLWLDGGVWSMEPFVPTADEWIVTPFFYALGGWPKYYGGKPIFYKLVYEKGPPAQFVGHIYGYWEAPDIQLIMEGPKTPPSAGEQIQIRRCFDGHFGYSCLRSREISLDRQISELQAISPNHWELKWFDVAHPMLSSDEQTQGIYLSASNAKFTQDRFIIINSSGHHQTLILSRPNTPSGDAAFQLVQKIIRSIRSFNELDPGRAWINRELEKIKLNDLHTVTDPIEIASRLALIQTLLISKISVDPSNFESYFHLAGTSFMLSKISKNNHDIRNSAAMQNLQNSYRFAFDIDPRDARTLQIQDLWLESHKE